MAKINIHPSLIRFTNQQNQIELSVDTVGSIIPALCECYPMLKTSILNADDELSPYVNVYINGKNLNQCIPHTPLMHHDQVDVVTALVGG